MKKNKPTLDKIEELYSANFEKYGIDSKSVGWPSAESQELRFSKLLEVVEATDEPFSLNELGCGYGQLFRYCDSKKHKLTAFHGYDISEKMLLAAKDYINNPRADFFRDSVISSKADYTVTSGIFNVKFDHNSKDWESFIKDTLKNMYEFSEKGIAFNLLTKFVDYEAKDLYYADPCYFFNFCKSELSRYVNLLHDYKLYEWTITVRK